MIAYTLQLPVQRTSKTLCGFAILHLADTKTHQRYLGLHRQQYAADWMQLTLHQHTNTLLAYNIGST